MFRTDLGSNSMIRVSSSTSNEQGDRASTRPSINADGLVVVFLSNASNLVGDGQGAGIFVNDLRQQGQGGAVRSIVG